MEKQQGKTFKFAELISLIDTMGKPTEHTVNLAFYIANKAYDVRSEQSHETTSRK